MKLTCIACMRREEIKAKTCVDWYYMPKKEKNIPPNKTRVSSSFSVVYDRHDMCHVCSYQRMYFMCACLLALPLFQIYKYENEKPIELDGPFKGRLRWNGSQDLQDVSIRIINVTLNDSGVYECRVVRKFESDFFTPSVSLTKDIKLWVKEKGAANSFPLSSCQSLFVCHISTAWC